MECYYCINAEHRGKGIAIEATKALVQVLSNAAGVKEVRAYCHAENTAAHDMALKSGMTKKGMAKHKNLDTPGQLFVRVPN